MIRILKEFLLILLPLFLKYFYLNLFIDLDLVKNGDYLEDFVFSILVFVLLTFGTLKFKFIRYVVIFFYGFYYIIETISYIAVSSNFSASFVYVLIESSKGEFSEFVNSYFKIEVIIFVCIILSYIFFLIKRKYNLIKKLSLLKTITIIIFVVGFLKINGEILNNAYYNVVRGAYGYFDLQNNFELASKDIDVADIEVTGDNDILVLIIGESTNRGHMHLYGYEKLTTPNLSSYKDSLYVYNNVISTDVLTVKAVPKILTSLESQSNRDSVTNIIEIINKAGYKTYWLSNQRPISYHDNAVNKIASMCSFFKFYNYQVDKSAEVLDEVLLPDYKSILKEEGKKFIVMRLIGTHFTYSNRYPKHFSKFKPSKNTQREEIRSHYDNAILYNDFIVSSILRELKEINKKSALLYLSDHGENVYDYGDFFGRTEENIKKSMFEIPFILWTSKSFNKPKDFDYVENRKFMSDHLYESIGHLIGAKHKSMDFSKSIFNKSFKDRERIVLNAINYDKYFLNHND